VFRHPHNSFPGKAKMHLFSKARTYSRSFISLSSVARSTLVVAICLTATVTGRAQLTVDKLIGDAVSDPSNARYADIGEAIERFTNRDVAGARQFLESAARKDEKLPPVDVTMAKMYFLSGNAQLGSASLEKTVQDHPDDPEAYLLVAEQAAAANRAVEADAVFDKAISLIEAFKGGEKRKRNFIIRARSGRAGIAEARRDWADAAADLQAWVEADPEQAVAHHRLGRALFLSGQAQDGFEHLTKAHDLEKKFPHPYVTAALLYQQLDQREQSGQAFAKALEVAKDDPTTLAAYAQWLLQSGDVGKAEALLVTARRAAPESLDILLLSGVAAQMAKKMKPAEDYYLAALNLSPSNRSVLNQLALLLVNQPDEAKMRRALEFASMNVKLYPDQAETNITLAWVLYQLRDTRQAQKYLQDGLRYGNRSADSSYLLAKILADQGRKDEARGLLDAALASNEGIFVMRDEASALRQTL
jgi:Tfp pilus assembly protein PilF